MRNVMRMAVPALLLLLTLMAVSADTMASASGGGWIVSPKTSATMNNKATFGFNTTVGNLNYTDHAIGLEVRGTIDPATLIVTGNTATFSGTATITNATMSTSGTFDVKVVDNGVPGKGKDTFAISIPAISYMANDILGGGNILVVVQ